MLDIKLLEKLGLTQEATLDDVAKSLGVYKIFENKETYTDKFKKELGKKDTEIGELSKKVIDLQKSSDTQKTQLDKYTNVETLNKSLISSLASKLKISGEIPFDKLDTTKWDIQKVDKELVRFATDNKLKVDTTDRKGLLSADQKDTDSLTNNYPKNHNGVIV